MKEKLYKIREVAKLHNITKKTMLYYEKIGLFKPFFIDKTNGYRYYKRVDFPILKQIIYLKDIGFSLIEIKTILESGSYDFLIDKLNERKKQVISQIKELQTVKENIDTHIIASEIAKEINDNDLNRLSLKIYKERKILTVKSDENTKESIMMSYRKCLNFLIDNDMFSHKSYGSVYYGEKNKHLSSGAFIELPLDFNIENETILKSGKYICMYHKGSYYCNSPLEYFLKTVSNNGYEIDSDVYDYCIVDRCFTGDENAMILEFQAKVK